MRSAAAIGVGLVALATSGCGGMGTGAFDVESGIETPRLGRAATPAELARIDVRIDREGRALPPGRGTATEGEVVYVTNCARCHGLGGAGKPADRLVGGRGTLTEMRPIKTVGSYWPHGPMLFDYVRRAMPYDRPGSLSADEVYAVAAYLLAENGIIGPDDVMTERSLAELEMPNRDGFADSPGWSGNPEAE